MSSSRSNDTRGTRLDLLCILAVVVVAFGLAPASGLEHMASHFFDDAFYYFQIARNVVAGHGFTFDGIHKTNGFHPAWLFLLTGLFRVVPGDAAPLRVVMILQALFVAAGCWGIYRGLLPRIGRTGALVSALAIPALPGALMALQCGMESSLLFVVWVALWRAWIDDGPWWHLGMLLAAVFLVRIEMALLLPILGVLGWRRLVAAGPRAMLAFALPTLVAATLYVSWNRVAFGTWLPISGMTKRALTHLVPDNIWTSIPWIGQAVVFRAFGGKWLWLSNVFLGAGVGLVVWQRRRFADWFRGSGTRSLLIAAPILFVIDKVSVGLLFNWYEVPIFFATAAVAGVLVARGPMWLRVSLILCVVGANARYLFKPFMQRPLEAIENPYAIKAARWLEEHVPEDGRIGSWNAGAFSYFSHRHVINLDGLVNDLAYYERVVRGGDFKNYLRDEGIDWIVDGAWIEHARKEDCVSEIHCDEIGIDFEPILRIMPPGDGGEDIGEAIWKRKSITSLTRDTL